MASLRSVKRWFHDLSCRGLFLAEIATAETIATAALFVYMKIFNGYARINMLLMAM